jgi:lipid-A-disaccharide synthase
MKYYLVAGEASGDLHGANLMKALKTLDPHADFRFFGGDLMLAEGGTLVKHYADMAFMGFVEVIANLQTILKNMKSCKQDISAWQPDVLILIDFPGFNLKIAEHAQSTGPLGLLLYFAKGLGLEPKTGAQDQTNCRSPVLYPAF